ncbi:MAG: flagellar hook-basal body complex protein [Armatimonadota bacterium]|nr:flagellar hook-basal body complex protein [Armatimonadota bacterium]
MIQGLYSSASAMRAQLDQQDVIANNLANISTPGFKRTRVSFSSFVAELPSNPDVKAQATPAHTKCIIPVLNTKVDQSNGQLEDTGAKTNLAIDGKGFFIVSKPSGETLTRSGNFKLNQSGQLVTQDGSTVLGESGPITITSDNWSVEPDGNVKVGDAIVNKLRLESGDGSSTVGKVIQGSLESSNVNVVLEMVSMIAALRTYEANQKVIQSLDQTLDKAINQMARIA